jgi:hydroxymethylpyrimidine pyrophosphatase-like HAD family hydrolase
MTKLLARVPEADLLVVLEAARALCGTDAEVTLTGDTFVEVIAAGVGKEVALAELARERRVPREQVVAFGDQLVDAAMLRWAGIGVAVANATDFALHAADEVTASNDDDGVAIVLERLAAEAQPRSSASVGA